jgi:ubiquinone/menaquinone biosynthesis C-methylase UbiE
MGDHYLMENDEEVFRLETKTDAEVLRQQTLRAGLRPGMRVADICCGSGLTTSLLGELAGPEGSVLGIDLSTERIQHALAHYGNDSVDFLCRDVREDLRDLGKFDFIWVRFVLEYYRKEAFEIVKNITSILGENGILCLIDLDHNCLNHYGISPELNEAVAEAMRFLEEYENFDPYAGRKLYSHLYKLNFDQIEVNLSAHHLIYGALKESDEFNWMKKIEVVSAKTGVRLPHYDEISGFLRDFHTFFSDPGRFTYTPLISCWGRAADLR